MEVEALQTPTHEMGIQGEQEGEDVSFGGL